MRKCQNAAAERQSAFFGALRERKHAGHKIEKNWKRLGAAKSACSFASLKHCSVCPGSIRSLESKSLRKRGCVFPFAPKKMRVVCLLSISDFTERLYAVAVIPIQNAGSFQRRYKMLKHFLCPILFHLPAVPVFAHPGIGIVMSSRGEVFYTDLKQV